MEKVQGMRGGDGLGDVHEKLQTQVHGDLPQPALRVRPFGKVEAGVFALNEVRGPVEVPLEQPNELGAVPERLPEEAADRHLALETLQANVIGRELEHPGLACLGVFSQPDVI